MSRRSERPRGSTLGRQPLARHLLHLIPRADQRELIREDLDEEFGRRIEAGSAKLQLWYLGAALESIADWWLNTLSWQSTRRLFTPGDVRRWGLRSGGWLSDVRFALRMIRREKVVSGAVVLTVLLGVSSTAAVATLLRGVLLRPLPYPDPEQIVRLSRTSGGDAAPFPVVGLPDLEDWRERGTSLKAVAGWSANAVTLTGLGQAERISVALVTPDLERVLDINPAVGRLFVTEDFDAGAVSVAVLTHRFWTDRFGGDPAVLGQTVELDFTAVRVVGVLPRTELAYPPNVDVWLPLAPAPDSWMRTTRGSSWLNAVGRLRAGTSLEAAERELSRIQRGLAEEFPRQNKGQDGIGLERLRDVIVAPARPAIRVMMAAIGVVLLLASINVGLLLLARSNRRRQEFSIRTVLGGERSRLARLILTEALVLAGIGGALGLPLTLPIVDAMVSLYPGGLPRAAEVRLDRWVVAASFLTICLAGGLAGLAPVVSLRKLDLSSRLRMRGGEKSRAQSRTRNVLVGAQLAVCTVLLIGATLLSRTLVNLRDTDPGFEPNRVLTFRIAPAADRYPTPAEATAFYRRLLSEIETIPGVLTAGGVNFLPFSGGEWGGGFEVEGVTREARVRLSWPGYYEALGLRLLRGRWFDWRDGGDGALVALLNETAARIAFDDEDPLGRQIEFEGRTREVVGILEDVRHRSLLDPPAPEVHVPTAQFSRLSASVVVRTVEAPLAVLPAVRRVVSAIDPNIPLTGVATMGERIEQSLAPERFRATLVAALGGVAALLALIGVYGVMSYAVTQRRREMGIRFALGEAGPSILARVLRSAVALSVAGVGAGLLIAWAGSRWLGSWLYEVSALDPWAFVGVAAAVMAAGTASALGPAIRASHVDPLLTIREE